MFVFVYPLSLGFWIVLKEEVVLFVLTNLVHLQQKGIWNDVVAREEDMRSCRSGTAEESFFFF